MLIINICLNFLLLFSLIANAFSFNLKFRFEKSLSSKFNTALEVSKHRASYGQFLDTVPKKKDPKAEKLRASINLKEILSNVQDTQTGAQLRSERERNLVIAEKTIVSIDYTVPDKTRKWSKESIKEVIDTLNESYGHKSREEHNDNERVGMIDWDDFNTHGMMIISDYESSKTQKKVISWVKFHRQKRNIVFDHDKWIWTEKRKR